MNQRFGEDDVECFLNTLKIHLVEQHGLNSGYSQKEADGIIVFGSSNEFNAAFCNSDGVLIVCLQQIQIGYYAMGEYRIGKPCESILQRGSMSPD